jgi:serine/threonine protein kinase
MLLFEMLTGDLPFSGTHPQALMRAKTNDEPKAPSYFLPSIDPALEAVIMRALARDPRERFETAAELLEALRDPKAVAARDPEAARARKRRVGLRRFAFPVGVVALLFALFALVRFTGRRTPAPTLAPTSSPRSR